MRKLFCIIAGCLLTIVGCASQTTYSSAADDAADNLKYYKGVQVIRVGDSVRVIVYSDKCFEMGEPRIKTSCYSALTSAAALFQEYGNTPIKVIAFSDDIFDPFSARFITQQQADAIVTYLWMRGIPATRFISYGYGRIDPIASNHNIVASSANRRIELTLEQNLTIAPQDQPPVVGEFVCKTKTGCYTVQHPVKRNYTKRNYKQKSRNIQYQRCAL